MTKQKLDDQGIENVNDDCKEIYEEIISTCDLLHWSENTLFQKCYYTHTEGENYTEEEEVKEQIKFCDKYKKMFQRKNWEKSKATKRTLSALEALRDALYKTEEYYKIETALSPKTRVMMRNISKDLDRKLKKDYQTQQDI